jgi:hypothetical protein
MAVGEQKYVPAALPTGKRPGTRGTGGCVRPKADLDGCGKRHLNRNSILGPSSQ